MENINGTIAMVDLDPHGSRAPRVGIISSAGDQSVSIKFADLKSESFHPSQVFLLIDRQSLYRALLSNEQIPIAHFKILFQVNMLQDKGDLSSLLTAYQLLKSSPQTALNATESLSELFKRSAAQTPGNLSFSR